MIALTHFPSSSSVRSNLRWGTLLAGVVMCLANPLALGQPALEKQPTDQSVSVGAQVLLQISATGVAPLSYAWLRDGLPIPNTNAILRIVNAQLTNAGSYSVVVGDATGFLTSRVAHVAVDPTFTKITQGAVVTDPGTSLACAWGDYDGDGQLDLFVTNLGGQKNFLYRNHGDGTFEKIATGPAVNDVRNWRGCAWADYDNDGRLDLVATCVDGDASQIVLYHNEGNGTFIRAPEGTMSSFVHDPDSDEGASEQPAWADYDNDGRLDLFIDRYGPDWLFHQEMGGSFTRVTNVLSGSVSERGYVPIWFDFNNDGRPDLLITAKTDPSTNRFFLNLGGGVFEHVQANGLTTDGAHAIGGAASDYDNDGFTDLFLVNGGIGAERGALYHNNGDGTFQKMRSEVVGSLVSQSGGEACTWGDYDNDGYLDIFVAAGGVDEQGQVVGRKSFLYHNDGDGSFSQVLSGSVVNDLADAVGCAWGDYDNDGFLDLFVAHRYRTGDTPGNALYRNNGNTNGWLKVKLVGTVSNRSAIGTKVRLKAIIRGKALWQVREITSSGPCQNALDAHFGLGDATRVDELRIEWPSGLVQTLTNLAPRQVLTVTEASRSSGCPLTAFESLTPVFSGAYGANMLIGDFNGDGKPDVMAGGGEDGLMSVLLGNGDGTFQFPLRFQASWALASGDFDGDGRLDLITGEPGGGAIQIWLGRGNGTFEIPVHAGSGSVTAVGDVNGDGNLDLIGADRSGGLSILLGHGDGQFDTAAHYSAGPEPIGAVLADFNGDGKQDAAVANASGGFSVLLGKGDGTFQSAISYGQGTHLQIWSIAAGDFDGDGKVDVVTGGFDSTNQMVFLFLGNGDGTFWQGQSSAVLDVPTAIAVGDFNGDGKSDVIAVGHGFSYRIGGVSILFGNGDGTFQPALNHPLHSQTTVAVADFNRDGKLDFASIFSDDLGAMITVWANTSCSSSADLSVARGISGVALSYHGRLPDFILERSPRLDSPQWQPVAVDSTWTYDDYSGLTNLTIPTVESAAFFRLRRP